MPKNISENAKDLLNRMLQYRNDRRVTLKELLKHPWFTHPEDVPIDESVILKLKNHKRDSFLKDTVIGLLVKQVSHTETQALRAQFETLDKDKNGFLD